MKSQIAIISALLGCATISSATLDLFVSSEGTSSVKRYDGTTGAYLGDFIASGSGGLDRPQGLTFGPDGNLYVSSINSGAVLRYNGQTGAFIGAFTTGPAMTFAADMSWHNGFLFVSDFTSTGHVNKYNATTGAYIGQFTADNCKGPDGLTWDNSGNLLVSAFGNNSVRKYSSAGAYLGDFVAPGLGGLAGSLDSRFDSSGNFYVNSWTNGKVKEYSSTGAYIGDFVTGLGTTQGQAIGPDGLLYVGSYQNGYIKKYNALTGQDLGFFANTGGLIRPNNFAFGPVPEPASLIGLGLGLAVFARRRGKKAA